MNESPTDTPSDEPGPALTRAVGTTLAAWGGANVVGGSVVAASGRGPAASAFGQQSAAWGAINVAIAGFGFWRSRRATPDLSRLRTILLVNAALDVGYMAAGALTIRSARGRTDPQAAARRGHGAAVIMQGAALGMLDTVFAVAATRQLRGGVGGTAAQPPS